MLEFVAIASLVFAAASLVFAFVALIQDYNLDKEVKKAAEQATGTAAAAASSSQGGESKGLAEGVAPQAAFGGAAEYLKALGSFAEGLSKLRQGVAALVVALAFGLLAATAAGIDDKVGDSGNGGDQTALVRLR